MKKHHVRQIVCRKLKCSIGVMNGVSVLLEFSLFLLLEKNTEINVEVEMEIFINFLDTFRFRTLDIFLSDYSAIEDYF